jgi:hypothetical protein
MMSSVTSCGWLIMATWELASSTVCAPARAAMARSASGGIVASFAAAMYQLGIVRQPGTPDGVTSPDTATPRCPNAMNCASPASTSAQKRSWKYWGSM